MSVSIFAPISSGNISVGFDTLGLALMPINGEKVGDIVKVEKSNDSEHQFTLLGHYANKLPQNKTDNIVWQCLIAFEKALEDSFDKLQIKTEKLDITLYKNIPVGSGLGSSACSVVAAFVAYNEYYQKPFDQHKLLKMMGQLEAEISGSLHYDNVAPCYLGGLQLMFNGTALNQSEKICQALPIFDDCFWIVAYPDIMISTKAAREILPESYDRKTVITFGQNLAGFVDASYRQDKEQAFSLLKDVIAEPYREKLLPKFKQAKESLKNLGSLATGISGSGPTLFSVCDNLEKAKKISQWLQENYLQSPEGFVHICKPDTLGARKV